MKWFPLQARDGDIAGAARTANSIQQDDIKADALDAIVHAQAKAGDLTAARSTLRKRAPKGRLNEVRIDSQPG